MPALLTAAMAAAGPEAVRTPRIEQPVGYWQDNGFAGMVPSIHLPTTHSRDDLIQVWLKLPEGAGVDARPRPDGEGWQLVLPPGTRADRAEYYRVAGPRPDAAALYLDSSMLDPDDWTLADVRGTRVSADGDQRFHVLRPVDGDVHAALTGWSWPRGDGAAQQAATEDLLAHCRSAGRPVHRPPMDEEGLAAMRRLNECAGCHKPDKPPLHHRQAGRALERGTDNLGFYVPTAVLSDRCVVANHRPEDLNEEDPFVTVTCGDEPAELVRRENGDETYVCPGERVPLGHRDVRAGLAAGHEYTERVCESRRWLAEHMTERARQAFAEPLAACGIISSDETETPN
ncbi:MAG: hypothetical protein K9L70_09260 [Thiohalocapsa sp.]|nr:hypothetical protein [Thiohalocapsa sp.]MCF7991814.1 hypothetical protein [Thiohalocapsa sp.]